MAKLGDFSRDIKAIKDGDWVNPGPEYDGLEILTKGLGPKYADSQSRRMKRASTNLGGESKITQEERNLINTESLIETCLMDVRGLYDEDGQPVSFERFCDLIRQEKYYDLNQLCFTAAVQLSSKKEVVTTDAKGNSQTG